MDTAKNDGNHDGDGLSLAGLFDRGNPETMQRLARLHGGEGTPRLPETTAELHRLTAQLSETAKERSGGREALNCEPLTTLPTGDEFTAQMAVIGPMQFSEDGPQFRLNSLFYNPTAPVDELRGAWLACLAQFLELTPLAND